MESVACQYFGCAFHSLPTNKRLLKALGEAITFLEHPEMPVHTDCIRASSVRRRETPSLCLYLRAIFSRAVFNWAFLLGSMSICGRVSLWAFGERLRCPITSCSNITDWSRDEIDQKRRLFFIRSFSPQFRLAPMGTRQDRDRGISVVCRPGLQSAALC